MKRIEKYYLDFLNSLKPEYQFIVKGLVSFFKEKSVRLLAFILFILMAYQMAYWVGWMGVPREYLDKMNAENIKFIESTERNNHLTILNNKLSKEIYTMRLDSIRLSHINQDLKRVNDSLNELKPQIK